MASIIDNRNKTMLDSLKNSLKQAESVDMLIETEGKENTENFKDDARFAVEFLKSIYSK